MKSAIKARLSMVAFGMAVLGMAMQSGVAFAQYNDERALNDEYNKLIINARRHFDEAMEFEKQGELHAACNSYNNTRDELTEAIFKTLHFRGTYDNAQTQRDIDMTMARARGVCGKEDTAGTWPPPSSGTSSSSSASGSFDPPSQPDWPDMSSEVAALQATIGAAYGNANESSRLYTGRDYTGSCAKARASAAGYSKARADAALITKASGSFRDVGLGDVQALDANVTQSARDADEFYCKPPRVAINFQTEINAFAAMKTALHLERGTVTPMTSERAFTMRTACVTDKLYAANKARLAFADALRGGCQSFVLMYNMRLPDEACTSLTDAKANLAKSEPEYAKQAKKLQADLGALQIAFKCSVTALAPAPPIRPTNLGGAIQEVPDAELPPMKLDIKPLPPRAVR